MQQRAAVFRTVGCAGDAPVIQVSVGDGAPFCSVCAGHSAFQRRRQSLQDQCIGYALNAQQALFAGFCLARLLARQRRYIGLQDMLCPYQTCHIVAYLKACCIGICQNDEALHSSYALEQLLQRSVPEHAESVRCQDRAVHDIGQPGGIVFSLHQQGLLYFYHAFLPASASSHSAFCISRSASSLLLFRSVSSCCRMRRQLSSWLRLNRAAVFSVELRR